MEPEIFLWSTSWKQPLDSSLNKDVHESVNCHNMLTNELPRNDKRKFGHSTPKEAASFYKRIFHPETGVAPKPSRITHDIQKVFEYAAPQIIEKRGTVLDKNNRKGRRYEENHRKPRGGKRVRLLKDNDYGGALDDIHTDAKFGQKFKIEKAKKGLVGG